MSETSRDLVRLDMLDDLLLMRAALARSIHETAEAGREVERLRERVRELELRRSDEVEEIQQARLLAAARARQIELRSRPFISRWATLLLVYSAALAVVACTVGLRLLYG